MVLFTGFLPNASINERRHYWTFGFNQHLHSITGRAESISTTLTVASSATPALMGSPLCTAKWYANDHTSRLSTYSARHSFALTAAVCLATFTASISFYHHMKLEALLLYPVLWHGFFTRGVESNKKAIIHTQSSYTLLHIHTYTWNSNVVDIHKHIQVRIDTYILQIYTAPS